MRTVTTLMIAALLGACGNAEETIVDDRELALKSVTGAGVRGHMEVLAADDMEGREAGTAGHERAADYVAQQFRSIGLQPLGDAGSYFQSIHFLETRLNPESAALSFRKDDQSAELIFRDDFIRSGGYGTASEEISAPLVFVGYGIDAPEYDHDDFEGIDATGKILVMISGAPPGFATDQRAFYSSGRGKQARAVDKGAVGIITFRSTIDRNRRPWARYLPGIGAPGMRWLDADHKPFRGFPELAGSAILSSSGAAKLFELAGHDVQTLLDKHEAGATGSFDLGVEAALFRESSQRTVKSPNVVGVIAGSDSELRNQYLVYSAHLDHIGIRPGEDDDDIHNGAYDNASGIAAILEIAASMAAMATAPRRSVIFAAVTAEEKGLQGSSYFAKHPPVPIRQIVANINIDMPFLAYPLANLEAFGAEHSTLLSALQAVTIERGLMLSPDPMPEEVRFVRSDQFSFVREGVPAVALKPGNISADPNLDGKLLLRDFLDNHYHRPSDDLSLPYSNEGAEEYVRAGLLLGLIIADSEDEPRWNEGDFFGGKFARQTESE